MISVCQDTSGALHPVLVPTMQKRCRLEGVKRRWSMGLRNWPVRKTKRIMSFSPGAEKAQKGPHHGIPVLTTERMEVLFSQGAVWEKMRGNCIQATPGEVLLLSTKDIFDSEKNQSLEQPHKGCGRLPITGGFQEVLDNLILAPFSHNLMIFLMIFQGPFQLRPFYDSMCPKYI